MLISIPFIMPWWFNCYSDEVFVPPPRLWFLLKMAKSNPFVRATISAMVGHTFTLLWKLGFRCRWRSSLLLFACWNVAPDVELFLGMVACTGAPKRLHKSDVLAYSQVKRSFHSQGKWFCGHLRTNVLIVMNCQLHDDLKQLCFLHAIFLWHNQYGRLCVSSLVMSMVTC